MDNNRDWVVWNGSLGILDMASVGRVEHRPTGRNAWLAAPYDVVGPFSLDELESVGRVAFGACLIMSQQKWQEDQTELRFRAREQRRTFAARFSQSDDELEYRERLNLPPEEKLTAAQINAAFRRLAKTAHPDAGGDHDAYCRLTEARDALLERVGTLQ